MAIAASIKREQIEAMLLRSLGEQRLSHAYVFSGPKGSGKLQTVYALAKALFCLSRTSLQEGYSHACGQCPECRKIEHGNHPFFLKILPDGASIKIDQIRELQRKFAYRSDENRPRMYVIEQAEKMTIQAANSLLKFLEEPGERMTAVLLTENPQALLPTIVSRVQRLSFAPLPPDEICEQLVEDGVPEYLARPASQLAAGLQAAVDLAQAEWFAESRNVVIQLIRESLSAPAKALLTVQQKVIKGGLQEHTEIMLQLFALLFKDMIRVQARRNTTLNFPDQTEWLEQTAVRTEATRWVRAMEFVIEARRHLRANVNPQLVLERLLLTL